MRLYVKNTAWRGPAENRNNGGKVGIRRIFKDQKFSRDLFRRYVALWRAACRKISRENCHDRIFHIATRGRPGKIEIQNGTWKQRRVTQREFSASIVQQHRHRTVLPCRGNHQVEKVVAIHIARSDVQAAARRIDADGVAQTGAELQADPVARRRAVQAALHRRQIRPAIAVKIPNREMRIPLRRERVRISLRLGRCGNFPAHGKYRVRQKDRNPQKNQDLWRCRVPAVVSNCNHRSRFFTRSFARCLNARNNFQTLAPASSLTASSVYLASHKKVVDQNITPRAASVCGSVESFSNESLRSWLAACVNNVTQGRGFPVFWCQSPGPEACHLSRAHGVAPNRRIRLR
jgi:hypothetical protein